MILNYIQHYNILYMTNQQETDQFFQSIRSYSSEQQQKPDHKKKSDIKITVNKPVEKQRNYFEADDTLQFGASVYEHKKMYYKEQKNQSSRKSSAGSDWNYDTDEIIDSMKNRSQNDQKNEKSQEKDKKLSPSIKYPVINELKSDYDISSPKKDEKLSLGNKFHQLRLNLGNSYEQQEININVSMIGQRKKNSQTERNIKNEEKHQTKVTVADKKRKQVVEDDASAYKSVYLSNVKLEEKKLQVQFKTMGKTMYWIYENKQVQITFQILQVLLEQFYKNQIFLPIICDQQFKSPHNDIYLKVYTKFLNILFEDLFKNSFGILKSANTGTKFASPRSMTPKSNKNIGKFLYDEYLMKFVKSFSYSKAEIIRNHQIKKLNMLKLLERFNKDTVSYPQSSVEQKRKELENQIGLLELFVSFENSEKYCQKNSEGIDQAIWKGHSKKLTELRKKWVQILQKQKNDFSFKI